jgi:exocyst complex component 7
VAYLERLPDVAGPAGVALRALGDGNWRMGEGVAVAKVPKLGEGDEGQILEHYVCAYIINFPAHVILIKTLNR